MGDARIAECWRPLPPLGPIHIQARELLRALDSTGDSRFLQEALADWYRIRRPTVNWMCCAPLNVGWNMSPVRYCRADDEFRSEPSANPSPASPRLRALLTTVPTTTSISNDFSIFGSNNSYSRSLRGSRIVWNWFRDLKPLSSIPIAQYSCFPRCGRR